MRAATMLAFLLSMTAAVLAADNEPRELEELGQAKEAYEAAVDKARTKLSEGIEKQIVTFAKSGKLSVVKEIQTDRDRFKSYGTLPESTYLKTQRAIYERELKTAAATVSRVYDRAIIALTKRLETDRAQELKDELETLTTRRAITPKIVTVKASIDWQPTEIVVTEGHVYRIQAKGKWRGMNGTQCGPDGTLAKPYEDSIADIMHMPGREKYLAPQPISSLIGRFGDEGWSFFVGTDCRIVASRSGKLSFTMNDLKEKSTDREGSLEVSVIELKNHKWIDESGKVRITGFIDTSDELILNSTGIRWKHPGGYDRVGVWGGAPTPTVINGVLWFPQWPNWPADRATAALKTSEFAPNAKRTMQDFKYTGTAPGPKASISNATNDEVTILVEKGDQHGAGVVSLYWRYAKP